MFYHKCIPNFAQPDDPELQNKVLTEIVKFNSSTLHLNISNEIVTRKYTILEPERLPTTTTHSPHINNMFNDKLVPKICAVFIESSRDYVQGGEFVFKNWNEPLRIDNFGHKVGNKENSYPNELNEQGSLIIFPALEEVSTRTIVSGELKFTVFKVLGDNYA